MSQTSHPIAGGPCGSLADAATHLRRPFMPALVHAKIQARDRDNRYAEIAYFIDARAVIDRLNVLLPGAWRDAYELIEQRPTQKDNDEELLVYRCRLTFAEVEHSDVGEGPDHKAAHSDALKRAAVHVGIGHCVYRMPSARMFPGDGPHQLRTSKAGGFYLDEANHAWLRNRYRAWLKETGIAEYGMPLDHGRAVQALVPELFPARFLPAARRPSPDTERSSEAPSTGPGETSSTAQVQAPLAALPVPTEREAPAEVPAARLEPVSQPSSEPPASLAQRAALVEIARERGYTVKTLDDLARCVCDTMLDRLSERGLHEVRAFLDSASGGRVADTELAEQITRLREDPDAMVGVMRDRIFDEENGLGRHPFLEGVGIPTRRYARELLAAQVMLHVSSRRESGEFARARHFDLQKYLKLYADGEDPRLAEVIETLNALQEKAPQLSEQLGNRAIAVSVVLAAWDLNVRGNLELAEEYGRFVEEFLKRLKYQVERMKEFKPDSRFDYLVEFQRHLTQAAVERPAVRYRHEQLTEQFRVWMETGGLSGDNEELVE